MVKDGGESLGKSVVEPSHKRQCIVEKNNLKKEKYLGKVRAAGKEIFGCPGVRSRGRQV